MLEAVNISKSFDHSGKKLEVLKGVDLNIKEGEFIAVVGPSGAGKSTLLHILGGLDAPSEGTVVLDGKNLYELSDAKLARIRNTHVGFVFQFYHLLPEFSALENVCLPLMIRQGRANKNQKYGKGKNLLKDVGLSEREHHRPNELSGGEQQRVAIARALVNDPKIIFCDEPTGNLDSQTGEDIINLLVKLNKKNSQTLVIVTHDDRIGKRAHRVVDLRDGRII